MLTYQWATAVLGLFTALSILYLVRRNHLHSRYAIWWLPAAFGVAILGLFPTLTNFIAPFFGVSYPPVLVLVLGLIALLIKVLLMDVERSRNEVKLERLIQKIAILEAELKDKGKLKDED